MALRPFQELTLTIKDFVVVYFHVFRFKGDGLNDMFSYVMYYYLDY